MSDKGELQWKVPEYPQYERGKLWYMIAGIVGVLLLIYSVVSGNFLFAVIVILGVLISLISSWRKPSLIDFRMSDDGVKIGEVFHPWDKFQSYWIVNEDGQKNLGLDLKNWLKTDLYLPIRGYSLRDVEKFVSKRLKKNRDRDEEPFSYLIGRKLKI